MRVASGHKFWDLEPGLDGGRDSMCSEDPPELRSRIPAGQYLNVHVGRAPHLGQDG